MISTFKYEPRIVDVANMDDIPEYIKDIIYDQACQDEMYYLIDYLDGDFKYPVNLGIETTDNEDDPHWHIHELKQLLPAEVVERNMFAIFFYQ